MMTALAKELTKHMHANAHKRIRVQAFTDNLIINIAKIKESSEAKLEEEPEDKKDKKIEKTNVYEGTTTNVSEGTVTGSLILDTKLTKTKIAISDPKMDNLLNVLSRIADDDLDYQTTDVFMSNVVFASNYDRDEHQDIVKFHMLAKMAAVNVLKDAKSDFKKAISGHVVVAAAGPVENEGEAPVAEAPPYDPANDSNKLLILIDPDSAKLVQRIYADYVSETDLSKLVQFILSFDKLLYKFRDGKPLEREEIEELEEIEEAREQKKKQRRAKKGKAKKAAVSQDDTGDEQGEAPDTDFDEQEIG